ncbi:MAG: hypothetical protein ACREOO_28670 [bacterium]
MPTPLDIEKHFQSLLSALTYPSSLRQRLSEVNRFLGLLGDDHLIYESYLLDLGQQLPELVRALKFAGCSPQPLRELLEKLRRLQAQMPALAALAGWNEMMRQLQFGLARLYANVGDWQSSLAVLNERLVSNRPDWLTELSKDQYYHTLELVRRMREHARNDQPETSAALDEVMAQWSPGGRAEEHSVLAPVVERHLAQAHIPQRLKGACVVSPFKFWDMRIGRTTNLRQTCA